MFTFTYRRGCKKCNEECFLVFVAREAVPTGIEDLRHLQAICRVRVWWWFHLMKRLVISKRIRRLSLRNDVVHESEMQMFAVNTCEKF